MSVVWGHTYTRNPTTRVKINTQEHRQVKKQCGKTGTPNENNPNYTPHAHSIAIVSNTARIALMGGTLILLSAYGLPGPPTPECKTLNEPRCKHVRLSLQPRQLTMGSSSRTRKYVRSTASNYKILPQPAHTMMHGAGHLITNFPPTWPQKPWDPSALPHRSLAH